MTAPTRVLVAEDDRVARDLLFEILRGEGYTVDAGHLDHRVRGRRGREIGRAHV